MSQISSPSACLVSDVWAGLLDALRERLNPQAGPSGAARLKKPPKSLSGLAASLVLLAAVLLVLAAGAAQAVPGLSRWVESAGTQGLANASLVLTGAVALVLPGWALWRLAQALQGWCQRGRELRLGLRKPWPASSRRLG